MVVGLGVLTQINLTITLAAVGPILATFVLINLLPRRIERYRRTRQESIGSVTDLLGEVFGAVQAIKVAGSEMAVVNYLEQRNEQRRRATLQDLLLGELLRAFSWNAGNIAVGILLFGDGARDPARSNPDERGRLYALYLLLGLADHCDQHVWRLSHPLPAGGGFVGPAASPVARRTAAGIGASGTALLMGRAADPAPDAQPCGTSSGKAGRPGTYLSLSGNAARHYWHPSSP